MLRQILLLLVASTSCLALGDGKPFRSTKNAFQKQAPQQLASVAAFHASQKSTPQAPQPAWVEQQQMGAPAPYSFGYDSAGSARQESGDASGRVTGSYKVVNEDGSVRVVNYVADEQGFRADVETDEPGTKSDSPAHVSLNSEAAPARTASSKYAMSQEQRKAFQWQQEQTHMYSAPAPAPAPAFRQERIQLAGQAQPSPYAFSYDSQMDDGSSHRSESGDGSGSVVGSYGLSAADGRRRTVHYRADADGFRADVDTNEMGTGQDSPADVQFVSSARQEQQPPAPMRHYRPQAPPASMRQQAVSTYKAPASAFQAQQSGVQYNDGPSVPTPYSFSYEADLGDGSSSRTESSDGYGKVTGSYSLTDADGRKRIVDYLADEGGFRATVNTNEFGTKSDSPADVQFYSSAPLEEPAPHAYRQQSQARSMQHASQDPILFTMGDNGAYSYSYQSQLEDGGSLAQKEARDGRGYVSGQYSMMTSAGQKRTVDYSAGEAGFQASVDTNEFGTKSYSPAHVQFLSSAPQEDLPAPMTYKSQAPAPARQVAPVAFRAPVARVPARQVAPVAFRAPVARAPVRQVAPVAFKAPAPQMAARQGAGSSGMYSSAFAKQQKVEAFQPSPYAFQYEADANGGSSARQESADGSGTVTGSYTVRNEDGSLRVVEYVADQDGFRANVKTNEHGTQAESPAHVSVRSQERLQSAAPLRATSQRQRGRFPTKTNTQKSSEVSQKAIDGW